MIGKLLSFQPEVIGPLYKSMIEVLQFGAATLFCSTPGQELLHKFFFSDLIPYHRQASAVRSLLGVLPDFILNVRITLLVLLTWQVPMDELNVKIFGHLFKLAEKSELESLSLCIAQVEPKLAKVAYGKKLIWMSKNQSYKADKKRKRQNVPNTPNKRRIVEHPMTDEAATLITNVPLEILYIIMSHIKIDLATLRK